MMPSNKASLNGVGQTPTGGLMNGSTVVGMWADKDKTIPIILGSMHRSDTTNSTNPTASSGIGS